MKGIRTSILLILSLLIFNITQSIAFSHSRFNVCNGLKIFTPDVNGRIVVVNTNSLMLSVLLQINTNSGLDAMGGATIILGFDTSAISFKVNPIKNIDYLFHNFCGGSYSSATVTRPMNNRIWVNIDLPFTNTNNGTIVEGGISWTDVVTINFDVIDPQGFANVYWLTNSVFWGIYDDDNISLWKTAQFDNASNIPLPVELSSFTVQIFQDNVQLEWITETEVNNFGFDIERKINDNEWCKIGFVEGHGNSNSPISYSFIDNHLTGGSKFYYKLKQIDTDGNYEYSQTIEVEYIPQYYALYQNYPNPFNPVTKIRFQLPDVRKVELKIFDIRGSHIVTLFDEEKEPGIYEIEFNGQGVSSGIYFYRLQAGSFVETKKMILLK
jgi:hypothetical protein